MSYRDDIAALGADHLYIFNNNVNDDISAQTATNVGCVFTTSILLCEDTTHSIRTNGTADSVDFPSVNTINLSTSDRKAVAFWCQFDSIQPPPKALYHDGGVTSSFKLVLAFGNNLMLECANTSFQVQVYGPTLVPNRAYHVCGIFESDNHGDQVRLYVDGVEYTLANPDGAAPRDVLALSRGRGSLGNPVTPTSVEVGNIVVTLNAAVSGFYSMMAMWGDTADAILTTTEVREELFEKGALPGVTISTDNEANMQAALNALSSTVRPNEPLNIRVEALSGGGDLTLNADNITHDDLASIHVQYMGTDTLTWVNENGSNASIGSTPNGGTITFVQSVSLTVTVLDASDFTPIENARVLMEADTGGPLTSGTDVLTGVTNSSGQLTGSLQYSADQPVTGRVRKSTSSPLYKTAPIGATITDTGISVTVLMVRDD